jgi:hypothetical protein
VVERAQGRTFRIVANIDQRNLALTGRRAGILLWTLHRTIAANKQWSFAARAITSARF